MSTAEASVMLALTSPLPPSRAATSTARRSFANWLLRLASAAPFLRLIVAHFEWPDTSHLPQDVPVETGLAHELGVEGCHDQVPLLQDDRALLVFGEHAHALADLLDDREPG